MSKIYGILGLATKAGKILSGFDSIEEGIKKNQVKLVIIANDTSEKTIKEIKFLGEKYQIPVIIYGTIKENSHAIGKLNRALIGICDSGFSKKIISLIDEEDKNT